MTFPIVKVFGFPPDNDSAEAKECRAHYWCPFLGARCTKSGHKAPVPLGTCSVLSPYGPVVTCPKRFYGDNCALIRHVASTLLGAQSNVVFIAYRLVHDSSQNKYVWEEDQRLPTSSRRLETAFIAGLLGQVPRRDEFERAISEKVVQMVNGGDTR